VMPANSEAGSEFDAVIALPFCQLGLKFDHDRLIETRYLTRRSDNYLANADAVKDVAAQLQAYSSNPQYRFQLDLQPSGSEFQLRVWAMLQSIPSGSVLSYGEIAQRLSSSARAVGNACRANPLPLIIPCHRVVAANGLGGFAGASSGYLIEIKRQLLSHEGLEF